MQILVTGAHGFIGHILCARLVAEGHRVVAGVHRPSSRPVGAGIVREIAVDFTRDLTATAWLPRLAGVDAVVNTVGQIREHGAATFARVHVTAARALFEACAVRGITRIVQLSALGADAGARSAYHTSKRAADEALLARVPGAWCAQPSLVFGAGGASARLFCLLAALPLIPVPGRGDQQVQPIHVDDLVAALCALLARDGPGGRVALVGPAPVTLRAWLETLRASLGLAPAAVMHVPWPVMRAAAAVGERVPRSLVDRATLGMLARGNVADPAATIGLLGHAPRPASRFIPPAEAPAWRTAARLAWLLPLLRASVAIVWIATAIVSLGPYPLADSYALLARTGVPPAFQPLMLFGAAALDLLLGVLVFFLHGARRRLLWRAQMLLIVVYSALIAWRLPEFWLHPYGPMLKNLPLLAVLVLLDVLEPAA